MSKILCILAILILLCLSQMPAAVAAGFAPGQVSASTTATFGLDSGAGTYSHAGNLLNVMRFSNTAGDGNLIKLEVLFNDTTPNGKVRMGVYSDNGGVPSTLLLDAGETTVANGWVSITGLNMPVYKNTYYWLAFDMQSLNDVKYQPGQPSGCHYWNTFAYGPLPTKFNFNGLFANSSPYVMRATVTLGNVPPVAINDSYGTSKNTALAVAAASGVLANDTDANGDSLTAVRFSGPAHGTLTLNSNGSFSYMPTNGYTGTDSFTYKANDGQADSNTSTVSITITNTPPVAVNDSYSTPQNTTLTVAAAGVLANDTDANGDSLTAVLVSGPAHGTLTLNSNGSFSYMPTTGYTGTDSFTYKANDGQADSNTATVSITITNTPPVAVNDSYSTPKNTTLTVAAVGVLANDTDANGDSLTAVLVTRPAQGTLTLDSNGSFTYTPTTGYTGSDSFTYKANDGQADSNTAIVSITITNTPPVAVNDSYSTPKNTTLTVTAASGVLANDTDADGDSLTAVLVTSPAQGTLSFNSNGSFTYTPTTGYTGSDSFTYKANDGKADSDTATVSITITVAVNIPPVAVNDSYSTLKNTTLTVAAASGVLANDTDANSDVLTAILISGPANGSLTLNNDGSFIYTPLSGFVGTDIFIYKANDGKADSNIALVSITVTDPNHPPIALNDNYTTTENTMLSVTPGVLSNDTDADGDTLTAILISGTSHGTLTLNSNGSFSYMPSSGYIGTDFFTYKANDGQANSNLATVTISIISPTSPATFGLNSGARTYDHAANYLDTMRFMNTAGSGNLTRLEILFSDSTPNGKVRLGVYSDNSGVPGTLLLDAGEVIVTNGWVAISGLDLPVSAGTYYWLAFSMNIDNIIVYQTGQPSGCHYWTIFAYGPLPTQFQLNGAVSNNSPYVMRATVYIN